MEDIVIFGQILSTSRKYRLKSISDCIIPYLHVSGCTVTKIAMNLSVLDLPQTDDNWVITIHVYGNSVGLIILTSFHHFILFYCILCQIGLGMLKWVPFEPL